MHERTLMRAVRSPAASTVFAVVFGLGGLAYAGSQHPGDAFAGGDGTSPHGNGGAAVSNQEAGAHGAEVAALALSDDLVGWHKGAAVSALASHERSQAGMHGPHAGEESGEAAEGHPAQGHGGGNQPGQNHAGGNGSDAPHGNGSAHGGRAGGPATNPQPQGGASSEHASGQGAPAGPPESAGRPA
jgi:hypothetical protein